MSDQDNRTIWCGNLPRELKDEHLYELFLQAGPLERVFRPKDRESGQPREYAFITYEDEESVPYALDLYQDTQLYGRTVRMQPRGVVKQSPQLNRSASLPMMPLNHHHQQQGPGRPWQQQQQQQQQPSNETMMRQMAARQMMMMAAQQAQQVAMAQRFPQQPFQRGPNPWQQQQQQPGPWQQQPMGPPPLMQNQFNNFGGGPRHHRRQTHHW